MSDTKTPLSGKSVVITGAAGGIGRALTFAFAEAGAAVAALDLDGAGAERVAVELRARGARAVAAACDVCDPAAVEAAMAEVARALGGIDVLVNNAGLSHRSLFTATDLRVVRKVMDVNFFGSVHCTKAALPQLIERKGVVVAISSVAGFAPLAGRTAYAAAKHALHGFFDTLRAEIAHRGVGVTIVCPSFVRTEMDRRTLAGDGGRAADGKPLVGRLLEPEEVAAAVVRAVAERRAQVVLSPVGKASYWLSRLLPRVYERVMRRTQSAAFPELIGA